jgi:hypothetical protein
MDKPFYQHPIAGRFCSHTLLITKNVTASPAAPWRPGPVMAHCRLACHFLQNLRESAIVINIRQTMPIMLRSALLAFTLLFTAPVFASLETMGVDFRTMLTNIYIFDEMKKKCPDMEIPKHATRPVIEQMLQKKLGIEDYLATMRAIMASDLVPNALASFEKLWASLEGCEDPRLDRAVTRIINVHEQSFARFEKEPGLKEVPVPLRR